MSRNNQPKSEALVPENAGKKQVRAVHAVAMRHVAEGTPVDEILRENPNTLAEFALQMHVKNVKDAVPGSMAAIKALEKLTILIDGNDDPTRGVIVPVTYVRRVKEDDDGNQVREQEIHQTVNFQLQGDTGE